MRRSVEEAAIAAYSLYSMGLSSFWLSRPISIIVLLCAIVVIVWAK